MSLIKQTILITLETTLQFIEIVIGITNLFSNYRVQANFSIIGANSILPHESSFI